ncbi:MAG TPA: DNA-formamidopyrimidine glycosylase family protein [Bryobacteraceae bacterium]|nr:DNA-formamidopyrimidine glycosylase family protein [Bryobacteraceae bacterium]
MPEGDTIFRAARTLNRALAGQVVTKFETQLPRLARVDDDAPISGRTVESVEATGKWIHIKFSGGLTLLTHMLMSGSWHIYRPGERWQRGRHHMRVAIYTQPFVAVAFQVPIAEFHSEDTLRRRRGVSTLGPDVLSPEFDGNLAKESIAAHPDLEVGIALLSQSIVAGLGNVFKSEVCFASNVHPFRTVASLSPDELQTLVANARKFMLGNVTDGSGDRIVTYTSFRRTTGRANPSERLWVYGRRGELCRNCGAAIESRKQGIDARVTFWCPQCQPIQGAK